mmetsp:Transcript_67415/g.175511  ORF Transcript_67415/g.175511 Transcript_67415/m.175511 type:complete len:248 (+) Transcript_67415:246-989(+)
MAFMPTAFLTLDDRRLLEAKELFLEASLCILSRAPCRVPSLRAPRKTPRALLRSASASSGARPSRDSASPRCWSQWKWKATVSTQALSVFRASSAYPWYTTWPEEKSRSWSPARPSACPPPASASASRANSRMTAAGTSSPGSTSPPGSLNSPAPARATMTCRRPVSGSVRVTIGSAVWFGPHLWSAPRPRMPVRPSGLMGQPVSGSRTMAPSKVFLRASSAATPRGSAGSAPAAVARPPSEKGVGL